MARKLQNWTILIETFKPECAVVEDSGVVRYHDKEFVGIVCERTGVDVSDGGVLFVYDVDHEVNADRVCLYVVDKDESCFCFEKIEWSERSWDAFLEFCRC